MRVILLLPAAVDGVSHGTNEAPFWLEDLGGDPLHVRSHLGREHHHLATRPLLASDPALQAQLILALHFHEVKNFLELSAN